MSKIRAFIVPLLALPLFGGLASAAVPAGTLDLSIERVRNHRGVLHICLTREARHFPNCAGDPNAVKRTIPGATATLRIADIAPGAYALSIFHDENNNGRLDSFVGIPREGFGFSRNPVVRFGAPGFRQVRIDLGPGLARQTVRMQYLL